MTVSSTVSLIQYAGNGVTTSFGFLGQFFAQSDLLVQLFNTGTGELLSPAPVLNGGGTYDYTVVGTQDPNLLEYLSGAEVVFNNAPPAGYTVTIQRVMPATQPISLVNNNLFPAKTVEGELDRLTLLAQQALVALTFALSVPVTDPPPSVLPPALARAGKVLMFDINGQPYVSAPPTQVITEGSGLITPNMFGAVGDGVTDDLGAILRAIAAIAANGGGYLDFLSCNYAISNTILIYTSNVKLRGQGRGFWHDSGNVFLLGSTSLTWIGANNGTMIQIAPPSGGQRLVGWEVSGMTLVAGSGSFASAAATGVLLQSVAGGKMDIATAEFSNIHVDFQIKSGLTEDANNQDNDISIVFRALTNPAVTNLQGAVLRFGGTNGVGNSCDNDVWRLSGQFLNGKCFDIVDGDNNRFWYTNLYRAPGGTGTQGVYRCQLVVNGGFARQNNIHYMTWQTGGGEIIVEGTEVAGSVGAATSNGIEKFDYGNDTPNIQVGTQANFYCGSNMAPPGSVYEKFTEVPGGGAGATVSDTRRGDVHGMVTLAAGGSTTINAEANGNTIVNGIQNILITPTVAATWTITDITETTFVLTVSAAGNYYYRLVVI